MSVLVLCDDEINTIFQNSYKSYLESVFVPAAAPVTEFEDDSDSSDDAYESADEYEYKKEKKTKKKSKEFILENYKSIQGLSKETQKFIKQHKLMLPKKYSLSKSDALNNVSNYKFNEKTGDLPLENALSFICRDFENVLSANDKEARANISSNSFSSQVDGEVTPYGRSPYISKITNSGTKFINNLMNLLLDYSSAIDGNNRANVKDNTGDIKLTDFYPKYTVEAFLGLNKDTLKLYSDMRRAEHVENLGNEIIEEYGDMFQNKRLFDFKENMLLSNCLGTLPVVTDTSFVLKDVIEDKGFGKLYLDKNLYFADQQVSYVDFVDAKTKFVTSLSTDVKNNYDLENLNNIKLFTLFKNVYDDTVNETNYGILSLERLLFYMYSFNAASLENADIFKETFKTRVKEYKLLEKTAIFNDLYEYFVTTYKTNGVYRVKDQFENEKKLLSNHWYVFLGNKKNAFNIFKTCYHTEKYLNSNFMVQYYDSSTKKIYMGSIKMNHKNAFFSKGKDTSMNLINKILIDMKEIWLILLNELVSENSTIDQGSLAEYGLYFPDINLIDMEKTKQLLSKPEDFFKMYRNNFVNEDYKTIDIEDGDNDIKNQNWTNLKTMMENDVYKSVFENNISNSNLLYNLIVNTDIFIQGKCTCHSLIDLFNDMINYDDKYSYSNDKLYEDAVWDIFLDSTTEDKGLPKFIDYNKYYGALEGLYKGFKNPVANSHDSTMNLNISDALKCQDKILNRKFFTLHDMYKIENRENLDYKNLVYELMYEHGFTSSNNTVTSKEYTKSYLKKSVIVGNINLSEADLTEDWIQSLQNYFNSSYSGENQPKYDSCWVKVSLDRIALSQGQYEKLMSDKLSATDLDGSKMSDMDGYQNQLDCSLELWDFDKLKDIRNIAEQSKQGRKRVFRDVQVDDSMDIKDEDKNIYFYIHKQPVKNVKKPNATFTFKSYLNLLLYEADNSNFVNANGNDGYPKEMRIRKVDNGGLNYEPDVFPMFLERYNVADPSFKPEVSNYTRNKMLFYNSNKSKVSNEVLDHINSLVDKINSLGLDYLTAANVAIKRKLKSLSKELDIMLMLYNKNEATAVRICHLLFYIATTNFLDATNLASGVELKSNGSNWNMETKINAIALLKVFCHDTSRNDNLRFDYNGVFALFVNNWTFFNDDNTFSSTMLKNAVEGTGTEKYGLLPISSPDVSNNIVSSIMSSTNNNTGMFSLNESLKQLFIYLKENDGNVKKNEATTNKKLLYLLFDAKKQLHLCRHFLIQEILKGKEQDIFLKKLTEDERDNNLIISLTSVVNEASNIIEEVNILQDVNDEILLTWMVNSDYQKGDLVKVDDLYYMFAVDMVSDAMLTEPGQNNEVWEKLDERPDNVSIIEWDDNGAIQGYIEAKARASNIDEDTLLENFTVYDLGDIVKHNNGFYKYKSRDGELDSLKHTRPGDPEAMEIWRKLNEEESRKINKHIRALKKLGVETVTITDTQIDTLEVKSKSSTKFGYYNFQFSGNRINAKLKKILHFVLKKKEEEYVVDNLLNWYYSKKGSDDKIIEKFATHLDNSLINLCKTLNVNKAGYNISTNWLTTRYNVFGDKVNEDDDSNLYDDEFLFGKVASGLWNLRRLDLPKKEAMYGLLNWSYDRSKGGGYTNYLQLKRRREPLMEEKRERKRQKKSDKKQSNNKASKKRKMDVNPGEDGLVSEEQRKILQKMYRKQLFDKQSEDSEDKYSDDLDENIFKDLYDDKTKLWKYGKRKSNIMRLKCCLKDYLVLMDTYKKKLSSFMTGTRPLSFNTGRDQFRIASNDKDSATGKLYIEYSLALNKIVFNIKLTMYELYNVGLIELANEDNIVYEYNILYKDMLDNITKASENANINIYNYLLEDCVNSPEKVTHAHILQRRKRYISLKEKSSFNGIIQKNVDSIIENNATLPKWFYNKILDTYIEYDRNELAVFKDSGQKCRVKGFNFGRLIEDAYTSYISEVNAGSGDDVVLFDETSNNEKMLNATEYFQSKRVNKDKHYRWFYRNGQTNEYERVDDGAEIIKDEIQKGIGSTKVKGKVRKSSKSLIRNYYLKKNKKNGKMQLLAISQNINLLLLEEFVKELNHSLFLDFEQKRENNFVQRYLWKIYDFESTKYSKNVEFVNNYKQQMFDDGHDDGSNIILYKYNSDNAKVSYDANKHGNEKDFVLYPETVNNQLSKQYKIFITNKNLLFLGIDNEAFEIYESPVKHIKHVRQKTESLKNNVLYVMFEDEKKSKYWDGLSSANFEKLSCFFDRAKEGVLNSSYHLGIDSVLKKIEANVTEFQRNTKTTYSTSQKSIEYLNTQFSEDSKCMIKVLQDMKSWFKDDSSIYKFSCVTPTIDYMSFYEKMQYNAKGILKEKFKDKKNVLTDYFTGLYYSQAFQFCVQIQEEYLSKMEYSLIQKYPAYRKDVTLNTFEDKLQKQIIRDMFKYEGNFGDILFQNVFSEGYKDVNNEYLGVNIKNIQSFENTCLDIIEAEILKDVKNTENVILELDTKGNSLPFNRRNDNRTSSAFTKLQYNRSVVKLLRRFFASIRKGGKYNSSLYNFKVDLYENTKDDLLKRRFNILKKSYLTQNRDFIEEDIDVVYQGKAYIITGYNETTERIALRQKGTSADEVISLVDAMKEIEVNPDDIKGVESTDQSLNFDASKFDDILLSDGLSINMNKEQLVKYMKYLRFKKFESGYNSLKEILHLFCGLNSPDGKEMEFVGILHYLILLWSKTKKTRMNIKTVYEGCKCCVITADGKRDKDYMPEAYNIRNNYNEGAIVTFNDLIYKSKTNNNSNTPNETSKWEKLKYYYYIVEKIRYNNDGFPEECKLRDYHNNALRNSLGKWVDYKLVVNVTRYSSSPYKVKNPSTTGKMTTANYHHRYETLNGNENKLILVGTNVVAVNEDKFLNKEEELIGLTDNELATEDGSNLDRFYNIKMLALERHLYNLIFRLIGKLQTIETFLKEKQVYNAPTEKTLVQTCFLNAMHKFNFIETWVLNHTKLINTVESQFRKVNRRGARVNITSIRSAMEFNSQTNDSKLIKFMQDGLTVNNSQYDKERKALRDSQGNQNMLNNQVENNRIEDVNNDDEEKKEDEEDTWLLDDSLRPNENNKDMETIVEDDMSMPVMSKMMVNLMI